MSGDGTEKHESQEQDGGGKWTLPYLPVEVGNVKLLT